MLGRIRWESKILQRDRNGGQSETPNMELQKLKVSKEVNLERGKLDGHF